MFNKKGKKGTGRLGRLVVVLSIVLSLVPLSVFLSSLFGDAPKAAYTNSIGMEFERVPAGRFMMGCDGAETGCEASERPRREVRISRPFYLGRYEVTRAQWETLMKSGPGGVFGDGRKDLPQHASWNDAQEFIRRLNEREGHDRYRLPTEAEWEYAARAGSGAAWSFGDDESRLAAHAWYGETYGKGGVHPVGKKKPNDWGLFDMHGNVWEWVQDWYDDNYASKRRPMISVDPRGPASGDLRVLRGGGWLNDAGRCRSASRTVGRPDASDEFIGFRLALDPKD